MKWQWVCRMERTEVLWERQEGTLDLKPGLFSMRWAACAGKEALYLVLGGEQAEEEERIRCGGWMDWGFVKVLLFKKKATAISPAQRVASSRLGLGVVPLGVSWEENPNRPEWCAGSCLLGSVGVGGCRRFQATGTQGPWPAPPPFPKSLLDPRGTFLSPQWG